MPDTSDTSATRTTQMQHECDISDTSATRVRHECYTNDMSGTSTTRKHESNTSEKN